MTFIAKGELVNIKFSKLGFGKKIGNIEAVMHEGFLGSNHKVRLVLDSKFADDVAKTLNHSSRKVDVGEYSAVWAHQHKIGKRDLNKHTIKIIIE